MTYIVNNKIINTSLVDNIGNNNFKHLPIMVLNYELYI